MTTPNGRDLDVELARLMGWVWKLLPNGRVFRPADWDNGMVVRDATEADPIHANETCWYLPEYHRSLDALFAPGGPVEFARSKGWWVAIEDAGDGWQATISKRQDSYEYGPMLPDPASALATALYEAFKEMER